MRRAPTSSLVVGLGNPGAEYAGTRHNVGAATVAVLARRHGVALKKERAVHAALSRCVIDGHEAVLSVPETFMNDSGLSVARLYKRLSPELPDGLVVVHDELDLPVGTVRVKLGGGTAGHNGLRSIESHLHSLEFVRVRVGIGRPGRVPGAKYVLSRPSRAEAGAYELALEQAADAVELVVKRGPEEAMNEVNRR